MSLEKHRKNSHAPFVVSGASVTNGTAIDFHQGHGIDNPVTSPHAAGNFRPLPAQQIIPIPGNVYQGGLVQKAPTIQPIPLSNWNK